MVKFRQYCSAYHFNLPLLPPTEEVTLPTDRPETARLPTAGLSLGPRQLSKGTREEDSTTASVATGTHGLKTEGADVIPPETDRSEIEVPVRDAEAEVVSPEVVDLQQDTAPPAPDAEDRSDSLPGAEAGDSSRGIPESLSAAACLTPEAGPTLPDYREVIEMRLSDVIIGVVSRWAAWCPAGTMRKRVLS